MNIALENFSGVVPRISASQLPTNNGQVARNVKLASGELRPWNLPKAVHTCVSSVVQTIFNMEGNGASVWLEFPVDTDICYGPLYDQDEFRLYYSEGGVCKKTNWSLATESGTGAYPRNWQYMGVPHPTTALACEVTPASDTSAENTQTRVYTYTYVNQFGSVLEEGSPADGATCTAYYSGGSVKLSGFADPPTDHYNIVKVRIYRQVTGNENSTYMLVDQIDLVNHKFPASGVSMNGVSFSDSCYVDTRTAAQLGKEMDSLYYSPPPEGLKGLVSMPNGYLAGFVGNQIWFSEPYLPHAWPSNYMLTTDSPIVGLGVYGTTLVVCTTRQPYTVTGAHPSSVTQEKLPMNQPCVSKRSIAYDQYGVLYASPYGLVAVAAGQIDVFTRNLVDQDTWATYTPSTMLAAMYNNLYMCAYKAGNSREMLVFARGDTPPMTTYGFNPVSLFVQRGTGRIFALSETDNKVYQLDADEINKEVYEWKSKRFSYQYSTSFSAMKVDADYSSNRYVEQWKAKVADLVSYNQAVWAEHKSDLLGLEGALNTVPVNTHEVDGTLLKPLINEASFRYVQVTLYADGEAVYVKRFTSPKAVRVPPVKAYSWEVKLQGNLDVMSFTMASTMRELASPQ